MKLSIWILGLMWLIMAESSIVIAQTIPPKNRINARVIRYLTGPAEFPLVMPTDVAIDSKNRAYVADGVNDRILRFTAEGGLDKIIIPPNGEKLDQPVGLAIDPNDQVWIADTGNHRIVVISQDGKQIKTIDIPPDELGNPADPTDLVISSLDGRCYVVDNNNHRLLIRGKDSGNWITMGKKGRALGQFDYPLMICIGIEEYIYLSETMGSRIQRISPTDRWSGLIGGWGVELGQFYRPKGVAADKEGRVFVSDSTLKVIQVFGPWGRVNGVLCNEQGELLRFNHPMGMDFDSDGLLYVVELGANRVVVVSLFQEKQQLY